MDPSLSPRWSCLLWCGMWFAGLVLMFVHTQMHLALALYRWTDDKVGEERGKFSEAGPTRRLSLVTRASARVLCKVHVRYMYLTLAHLVIPYLTSTCKVHVPYKVARLSNANHPSLRPGTQPACHFLFHHSSGKHAKVHVLFPSFIIVQPAPANLSSHVPKTCVYVLVSSTCKYYLLLLNY